MLGSFKKIKADIGHLQSMVEKIQDLLSSSHETEFYSQYHTTSLNELRLDLVSGVQILASKLKGCSKPDVTLQISLQDPTRYSDKHVLMICFGIRLICLKTMNGVSASQVEIEISEEKGYLYVEVNYHEVDMNYVLGLETQFELIRSYFIGKDGELDVQHVGKTLYFTITIPDTLTSEK